MFKKIRFEASLQYSVHNGKWTRDHEFKKFSELKFVHSYVFHFSKLILMILIRNKNFLSVFFIEVRQAGIEIWSVDDEILFRIFEFFIFFSNECFWPKISNHGRTSSCFWFPLFLHNQISLWEFFHNMSRSPTHSDDFNHDIHMIIKLILHDSCEKYCIEIVSFMSSYLRRENWNSGS